jgi:hypothetical protein
MMSRGGVVAPLFWMHVLPCQGERDVWASRMETHTIDACRDVEDVVA